MEIRLIKLYHGQVKRVLLLALDDECPAQKFLNEVYHHQSKEFNKLVQRIHMLANTENFRNSEIFKHERDGIYVWKTHSGFRLYAFHDDDNVIVAVNGGDKSSYKKQTRDIDRAIEYRVLYHQSKIHSKFGIPILENL